MRNALLANSQINFTATNNSILGGRSKSISRGVTGDIGVYSRRYQTGQSVSFVNTLVTNTITTGMDLGSYNDFEFGSYSVDGLNIYGNRDTPIALPVDVEAAAAQTNPQLGNCIVYIPETSPMSGAGAGGANIGATVLYRYQDGNLTHETLWDVTTGAFPCGAIVPGVNDIPGKSCFDVHERLHVNSGGCNLPSGYDSNADGIADQGDP
jgi:hypothetical protein